MWREKLLPKINIAQTSYKIDNNQPIYLIINVNGPDIWSTVEWVAL